MKTISLTGFALLALAALALPALAEDPTFKIEMKDGVITPLELIVPANTRVRLEVSNTGTKAAEFESVELKKEKVIAPGNSAVVVIRNLTAGTYGFYDEFSPEAPHGKIIAK